MCILLTNYSIIPPSNCAAVRASGLGAGAGQAAEVPLVRVVRTVDAAVAELGDGQASRVVSALELVAQAGDGAFAHGWVLVRVVPRAAVGLAVADPPNDTT